MNNVGPVKNWPLFFRASGAAVPDMPSGLGEVYLAPFRFLVKPFGPGHGKDSGIEGMIQGLPALDAVFQLVIAADDARLDILKRHGLVVLDPT